MGFSSKEFESASRTAVLELISGALTCAPTAPPILRFIERDGANQYYSVVFTVTGMRRAEDGRYVMEGSIEMSGEPKGTGFVEFDPKAPSFHRIRSGAGRSTGRLATLMPDKDDPAPFRALFFLMSSLD